MQPAAVNSGEAAGLLCFALRNHFASWAYQSAGSMTLKPDVMLPVVLCIFLLKNSPNLPRLILNSKIRVPCTLPTAHCRERGGISQPATLC